MFLPVARTNKRSKNTPKYAKPANIINKPRNNRSLALYFFDLKIKYNPKIIPVSTTPIAVIPSTNPTEDNNLNNLF